MNRNLILGTLGGGAALAFFLVMRWSLPERQPAAYSSNSTALAYSTASRPVEGEYSSQSKARTNTATSAPSFSPRSGSAVPESAFVVFSDWVGEFLRTPGAVSEARGRALAWKRKEAMLQLIRENPEKALVLAAPYEWRKALPAAVTQYFEERIDGTGSLDVAVCSAPSGPVAYRRVKIGGRTFAAFVYGRRLSQSSHQSLPLHGIALDGKLALDASPIRLLEPAEAAARQESAAVPAPKRCAVCGQAAMGPSAMTADTGGELAYYCGVEHQEVMTGHWVELEKRAKDGSSTAKDLQTWSLGPKLLLYMRVNFPDDLTEPVSESSAYEAMNRVNDFYVENSYDRTYITAIVTPLLTLPLTKAFYAEAGPFAVLDDARSAALQAGYDTAFFDFDIVCHTSVPGFDWAGLGFVGGKGTWLQSPGAGVTAHELGHNYGLWHANFWDTSTNNNSGIAQGWSVEYGNNYDTMGAASAGRNHFNACFKSDLGWLPSTAVVSPASNGVYRLYSFDLPGRLNGPAYALRVRKDFQRVYWLELRQQFAGQTPMANGLLLNWSPWAESKGGTDLIDTTPGSLASDPRSDAALVIGRTFSDLGAGVHITPLRRGVDGTNNWIDVQVNLGAFEENLPPAVRIETDILHPQPVELVHFHADAKDPDGDQLAYAWWFDYVEFSTNNLSWVSKSWAKQGAHVVRCVVSDMKGGVASANAIVNIGQPVGNLITGRVMDTNGVPVEGVRVDNFADTNSSQTLLSYTDSEGRYAIPGVLVDANLAASKYGFTFDNPTWTNPISAGADFTKADFVATGLPVLTISASPGSVVENSSLAAHFLLKRSGDTSTNLLANVYLSGSATLGRDYTLKTELTNGVNVVEFPPGVDRIEVDLQPINDSLAEGPENATLTLVENDAYVIGALGHGTVQILDDDLPQLPRISMAASNPYIPENGMDSGEVLFTRTGSTAADLYVYYGFTGSATPGVDYVTPAGVVLIPAGQSTATVRIVPIDDKEIEADETILISPLPAPAYVTDASAAELSIIDDDYLTVTVSTTSAGAKEPATHGVFTVKRDGDLSANLTVFYSVTGTATSGADYVPLSGRVLIPAGSASAEIVVTPVDDALVEGDESLIVTLLNAANYDVGNPATATLYIADDEKATVTITASDDTASEPGENLGSFVISRGDMSSGPLTVYLAISGTAGNGIDYVPLAPVVVIPDKARSVTLDVIPFDDLHVEPIETVQLVLLPSTNYNVGAPFEATVYIEDDDFGSPAVGFTFSSSSAPESESPGIHLSLSAPSWGPVTVNYRVIGGTATSNDYVLSPGPLTIDAGRTNAVLPLRIRNNTLAEPDRTIRIALYDPVGATLDGIKIHTYTIRDDDSASVSVSATAPSAFEKGSVSGNFRITRSGSTNADLEIFLAVAGTAAAPTDYAPLGNSIVLPAGASYVDLPVFPVDDQTVEFPETVILELLRAPGAKIVAPSKATVTIYDNESTNLPLVMVTSTNGPNAVEGGTAGEFTFYRHDTNGPLTLYFTVTGTALAGADYAPLPSSVTFSNGQGVFTLPVYTVDDSLIEGEETVLLSLTELDTYRVVFPGTAMLLLQDNDQRVQIDAGDFVASEPGTNPGEFTFTRFGSTNSDLRVNFSVGGTASNGVDYVALPDSILIPAGSLSATLPVHVIDDRLVEGPETVTVTLLSGNGYSLGNPKTATVTINDNEPMLTISASVPGVIEGSQRPGVFTVTRSGDPSYEFTAYLAVAGTATFGVDYPPFPTEIFFACGTTEIDLPVYPYNELMIEGPETVSVTLLPSPAYTILSPSNAVVTIADAGLNQAPLITLERPRSLPAHLRGPTVTLLVRASVTDDGGADSPTNTWSMVSGPCPVSFGNTNTPTTTVTFTNAGFYLLRLTADDGQLQSFRDVPVNVIGPALFEDAALHWALDDGQGTVAADSSGHGRDGLLVGNPRWVPAGAIGGALEFLGPGDSLRGSGTSNLFNQRDAFSISLWFNAAETNADQAIFCANSQATNGTLALYARPFASCGQGSDVYEATLRTTAGTVRYVSASQAVTSGWHNLILTWQSGFGLVLFIDGERDRPGSRSAALGGVVSDSPEFVIGRGPADAPFPLRGQVDEVMVFPYALDETEAAGIGSGVCTTGACRPANFGPEVEAGTNVTV